MAGKKPTGNRPPMGNLLNLERVPALAPKFANQIGKTCASFVVHYTEDGIEVVVASKINAQGVEIANDGKENVSIPEWERRRALKNAPSNEERLNGLRRKFELRLNREFPANGPSSGSEEDVQAWLATLPFAQRRALLMSQKDFSKSYPEGFR
jgi:hypothetical protein